MSPATRNRNVRWKIRLFDGPVLVDPLGHEHRRFRSSRASGILGYLALRLGRACSREELYEAIWPEVDVDVAANRFRVALTSLRRQLEPEGVPYGSVLDTSEFGKVRLRAEAVWCDTDEAETLLRTGQPEAAADLVRGELLPGNYDDWAVSARERFAALFGSESRTCVPTGAADVSTSARTDAPESVEVSPFVHYLPPYLTRYIGRDSAQQALLGVLRESRLVTLTGPGGVGKSRLAAESLRTASANVFFIPLADLDDGSQLSERVMATLSLSTQANEPGVEPLAAWLRLREPVILVLDNAEHLVDAAADLVVVLLGEVAGLRILVTSRRRLEVDGEQCFPLSPLRVVADPDDAGGASPAIALFTDRARLVRPDFALSARNSEAVGVICSRLEGIPLAIELAAARIGAQSPNEIAAELAQSLIDLGTGGKRLPRRHRSLRAAIQGSYEMLDTDTKRVFSVLSVFHDGWTAPSAAYVVGKPSAANHLSILAAGSLVGVEEDSGSRQMRFRFLEPIRQFAGEMLSGEERRAAASRHATYYLGLASLIDQFDIRTFAPLDSEMQNLESAIENADRDSETFWLGLAGATTYAFVRGRHRTALRWLDGVMHLLPDIEPYPLRSRVAYAACLILPDLGRTEPANRIATQMRDEAVAAGDRISACYAASILAYMEEGAGNFRAAVDQQLAALDTAREVEDLSLLLHCLSHTSGALHNLGLSAGPSTAMGRSALVQAETLSREMLSIVPPWSRRVPLAYLLTAAAVFYQRRWREAAELVQQTIRSCSEFGTYSEQMYAAAFAADIALQRGQTDNAAVLFGAFDRLRTDIGYSSERLAVFNNGWAARFERQLQSHIGADAWAARCEEGRGAPLDKLVTRLL